MEYRSAILSDLANIDQLHPELAADRPELCRPAFPENPIRGEANFPFIFYALDGQKVVGSRKATPDYAIINGKEYPWAWCFDTIVDSTQRGKGVGSRLVERQVAEFNRLGILSGAAFSAPAMMHIYAKLGYRVLDLTPRMVLVRNVRPFLSGKVPSRFLLKIGGAVGNLFVSLELLCRGALSSNRDVQIERLNTQDVIQVLTKSSWRSTNNRWGLSPDWIVARLRPADELFKLTIDSSATPSAIFVLREREATSDSGPPGRRLSLMHFESLSAVGVNADAIAAALSRELFRRGCDVADLITSSPKLLSALRKRGYKRRGTGMTFVYKVPSGVELNGSTDIADWHLTHYCSDGFLFE